MNYYAEKTCEARKGSGEACTNKAYYEFLNKLYCGVHCKDASRKELPKNPNKEMDRQRVIETHIHEVFKLSASHGGLGKVTCRKMRMMKEVELMSGYLNVFPNFKHQNRKDGYGCKELSPMSLGPVHHMQPGLPPSLNIENYHQGNKYFQQETIEQFLAKRQEMYLDPIPHRHKYDKKIGYTPLFCVHVDPTGMARGYSYRESRYFYCHFYEKLAKQTQAYVKLIDYIRKGVNLCIVGYDAYEPTLDVYKHYMDTSKPFGHELVLYCLLTIYDPAQYPWNVFYRENQHIYYGMLQPNLF